MAPNKQKPIKKVQQPSSDEEEEDEEMELDSDQLNQLEDSDDLVNNIEEDEEDDNDEDEQEELNGDYDSDESLNSDEIPNLSITEDEDEERSKKKQNLKNNVNDDSNSVLGDLHDEDDDDEEEESELDSDDQEHDLDNIEAEYSEEDENDEQDKELFQQNVNSSNYFEKILKISKQNLSQIEDVELVADFLKKKPLLKVDLDKEEIYKNDEGEFKKIIEEMAKNSKDEEGKLHPLTKLTKSKNLHFEQGISILNSKNEIFANYLICLHFYMLYKLNGISLKDSPVVKKLIYYKTLLSKLKPIEQKMEYQISKLMKLSLKASELGKGSKAVTSTISQDPINFKPRPELLDDEEGDQEDISENVSNVSEDEEKPKKTQAKKPVKYVAPKTQAVYQEKDTLERKMEVEKKRRTNYLIRQLSNNFNSDINEFKNDKPAVQRFGEKDKMARREREIREYEESNFVRLPTTKADKKRSKELEKNKSKLERIDDMSDLKNIRELLHHQKLSLDPQIERQEKERLKQTISKYNNKRQQNQGGNKFNKNKGANPTKKVKRN